MLKYTPLYIIILLLSSCITISINENNYRQLSDEQKKELRQYPSAYDAGHPASLVEITAQDIKSVLDKQQYTWVHLWLPYCKGPNCMPLFYYDKIADDNASKGLQLFLVSQSYNLVSVQQALSRSTFSRNIYVLKDAYYSHKTRKGMIKFINELITEDSIRKKMPSHFVFKGHKLIYYGENITGAQMDSVIRNN